MPGVRPRTMAATDRRPHWWPRRAGPTASNASALTALSGARPRTMAASAHRPAQTAARGFRSRRRRSILVLMPAQPRRRLATVLFLDIVGSTELASELGDRRWRELLTRFRRVVRTQLKRHGGR